MVLMRWRAWQDVSGCGGCRFDCLCVVKDQVDPQMDERLAKFVVQSHHHSHPANQMDELQRAAAGEAAAGVPPPGLSANAIDQDLLRLYIAYAKKHCHPKLQDADTSKMVQVRPLHGAHPCRVQRRFACGLRMCCRLTATILPSMRCFSSLHEVRR